MALHPFRSAKIIAEVTAMDSDLPMARIDHSSATITPIDRAFITAAVRKLERPGRFVEFLNAIGKPAEAIVNGLPRWASSRIDRAVQRTLLDAVGWAARTLDGSIHASEKEVSTLSSIVVKSRGAMHVTAAAILGGVGGAFGIAALPIELPVTTMVILRSIAAIARDFDADLDNPATRLECVSVLSFGASSSSEETMESSYLTSRIGLALLIQDAGRFIAGKSTLQLSEALARGAAPEVTRLISALAARFGFLALDLAYAEMVPVAGAIGGAALNGYFANFFNQIACYHFGLRRLERIYGEDVVQRIYREEMRGLEGS
jgi:EcsC protein family